ncbi:MAG TPA: SulP family inorganic anion transporter [Longimicrobiales bacterium]|nr:SulP family inorganic anion transporter [Longimicrobiales bacterium]
MTPVGAVPKHRFSRRDVLAGVSVALVAIPQALAYAELAGIPGAHGLYAVALPLVAAAFFASSPHLQTGPVATTALLTFGALVPMAAPRSGEYVALAALLALVVGVVRIAVGALRAGWISYLMSRPVLDGFMSGAAILIVASQIPGAAGVAAPGTGVMGRAAWTMGNPGTWEPTAVVVALLTVAVILGSRRVDPRIPGVLVAAVGGLVFSILTGYAGPRLGAIPAGLPPLTLDLPWQRLPSLVLPGVVIAMVGFAEAASICRTFASEDRERWDANREFVSQGAANVVAGLTGGFPVGGSFARSSLNRLTGASSRWAGLVTGVSVLLFLPLANVLAELPRAVLAGVVIAAVVNLFRPQAFMRLWAFSKPQAVVGWSTFVLTIFLAPHVEHAVLIGILMAGAVHLWRELAPEVETRRHGDTLVLEPRGVLWFGSAPVLDDRILASLDGQRDVERVVIRCGGLGRIDFTGAQALAEMLDQLRGAGLTVELSEVPEHAYRVLDAVGVLSAPGPSRGSS